MFDPDQFVAECRAALSTRNPPRAARHVVARVVSEPDGIVRALGEPEIGGLVTLHASNELTVLNVVWPPGMTLHPHNHGMWACIGVYCGREDNTFFQRHADGLRQHGSASLTAGDTMPLGHDIIHGVSNPLDQVTAALHVYGGDFFNQARSEWDPDTLLERPYDIAHTHAAFRAAHQRGGDS